MSRAVITGVGVVSAFGVGAGRFFDSLAQGKTGVGPIRSFDVSTFPTKVAGEVPVAAIDAGWIAKQLGETPGLEKFLAGWSEQGAFRDRKVAFALLAGIEAWRAAGCKAAESEASVVLALGLEQALLQDFAPCMHEGKIDWKQVASAQPEISFRSEVDLSARILTEWFDLKGSVVINSSACAAGTMAVAQAAALIDRGMASVVLCGGADSMVNPLGIGGMSRLGAPSPRAEADACRPFDRRRDGLVVGEGAAVFVLESEAHARARGAKGLATVLGWGTTQDGYRVTAPRPDGSCARNAMLRALKKAGLAPSQVQYINAHGTGTPLNDPAEARAIREVFGAHADQLPVSSIKGAVGHLMAASGAIELAACLMAFERDLLPGTANLKDLDPECPLAVIGPAPLAARVNFVLSNSFGFGGQNASVILGRCS